MCRCVGMLFSFAIRLGVWAFGWGRGGMCGGCWGWFVEESICFLMACSGIRGDTRR